MKEQVSTLKSRVKGQRGKKKAIAVDSNHEQEELSLADICQEYGRLWPLLHYLYLNGSFFGKPNPLAGSGKTLFQLDLEQRECAELYVYLPREKTEDAIEESIPFRDEVCQLIAHC